MCPKYSIHCTKRANWQKYRVYTFSKPTLIEDMTEIKLCLTIKGCLRKFHYDFLCKFEEYKIIIALKPNLYCWNLSSWFEKSYHHITVPTHNRSVIALRMVTSWKALQRSWICGFTKRSKTNIFIEIHAVYFSLIAKHTNFNLYKLLVSNLLVKDIKTNTWIGL